MERDTVIDNLAIELQLNYLNKKHDYFKDLRELDDSEKTNNYCEALYTILIEETTNYLLNDTEKIVKNNKFYFFFKLLYNIGNKVNFYWDYCSFSVYQKTFDGRFREYKKRYKEAELIDFVNSELENNCFLIDNKKSKQEPELCFLGVKLEYFTSYDLFYFAYKKKRCYLKDLKSKNKNTLPDPNIEYDVDLSNTGIVEKLIYLNESGIIDFLLKEPCFTASTNNLASFLSAITGEKQSSLYPALNPMLNKHVAQKNNPYKTDKTVNEVTTQMIKFGIKPK